MSQLMEPYVFQWLRTRNSVSDLVHNFSVMVLKTDMNAVLQGGAGGAEAGMGLIDRARLFVQTRDNQGLTLIDKNREELQEIHASLSGLDKLQAQSQEHMAAPSHLPMVKLTGVTPAGLNASSEGEITVWYDHVQAHKTSFYGPHMPRILEILQLHLFGNVDPAIGYAWPPLSAPTVKELSEIRKSNAETDKTYVDMGAISPDEVRERVGSDPDSGYNNLQGEAPGPPEAELMDKEHTLGQEGAEADHERGKETAEEAHKRALEMAENDTASDEWNEGDHPRGAGGKFGSGNMSGYMQARKKQDELYANVKALSVELDAKYPAAGTMGLRSDEVKATPEFQAMRRKVDVAFAALQNFNGWVNKSFAKEAKAYRKANPRGAG